jgi:hypothetical protein
MATKQQIIEAIVLCNEQEKHVNLLRLSIPTLRFSKWIMVAETWSLLAIQKLQLNAVILDRMLEVQESQNKSTEYTYEIPPTPEEYTLLVTLMKHTNDLDDIIITPLTRNAKHIR